MDKVLEFCRRVLGPGEAAEMAAAQARGAGAGDLVRELSAAARACRDVADASSAGADDPPAVPGLRAAVTQELIAANARLPERQREALALRELLALPYDQIAAVMHLDAAATAPLLARARLRLRVELRGAIPEPETTCEAHDRVLRLLARRQDGEAVAAEDEDWLLDHLVACTTCETLHAAMLEASVCYRAWAA